MKIFAVIVVSVIFVCVSGWKNSPLGPYNISDDITASGLSSGGFMTAQVHVAFSSIIKAAAVFAGVREYY
jgi:hypothetical protein